MLNPLRPLGRLPFFAGLTVLNTALLVATAAALTFLPAGGGHIAVLVIVGALHGIWGVLHARRFADAGRGPAAPIGAALALFSLFAGGYLLVASLWSVPAVQEEAFRTGGGIGARHIAVETSETVIAMGRALSSVMDAAQAVLFTGAVIVVLMLAAAASGVFSIVTLFMAPRRASVPPEVPERRILRMPRFSR